MERCGKSTGVIEHVYLLCHSEVKYIILLFTCQCFRGKGMPVSSSVFERCSIPTTLHNFQCGECVVSN